uniref:Uncharacterized protein n=2 Tax=Rhizophora mucronata TaxID=61149 RepID=A0A2P2IV97_RHIMU
MFSGAEAVMEQWVPLFDIFLNSPTPETEASLWFAQSFNAASSNSITTSSFLSLLTNPIDSVDAIITSSSPPTTKRVIFIETLPHMVQSRILSFLAYDHDRFCKRDVSRLARRMLAESGDDDFWVERAARSLLDKVSEGNYKLVHGSCLHSSEESDEKEFWLVPDWLKDAANTNELFLPWLPLSHHQLRSRELFGGYESEQESLDEAAEVGVENLKGDAEEMEIDGQVIAPIQDEIQNMATCLRARVMNFESISKTVELATEIRRLCLETGGDSLAILGMIEPWKADDEVASVLISHLLGGKEENLVWPSQVLCTIVLPKMLVLEEPVSRVLLTATIEFCKPHQRAAEYALLFPVIMRKGGINNPISEVLTKIIKECLHPAHVSALCQKLLCGEGEKRFISLPCHQCLVSNELVWTESLFSLFHNILNLHIQLTPDSVDPLVFRISESPDRFSKSLKFGNFLLCFVSKCSLLPKTHKPLLIEAAKKTNTVVTKSILSKLGDI